MLYLDSTRYTGFKACRNPGMLDYRIHIILVILKIVWKYADLSANMTNIVASGWNYRLQHSVVSASLVGCTVLVSICILYSVQSSVYTSVHCTV